MSSIKKAILFYWNTLTFCWREYQLTLNVNICLKNVPLLINLDLLESLCKIIRILEWCTRFPTLIPGIRTMMKFYAFLCYLTIMILDMQLRPSICCLDQKQPLKLTRLQSNSMHTWRLQFRWCTAGENVLEYEKDVLQCWFCKEVGSPMAENEVIPQSKE